MAKQSATLKKGDTIHCQDAETMIDLMYALNITGYGTEFLYEKDGQRGLWIEITKGVRDVKKD